MSMVCAMNLTILIIESSIIKIIYFSDKYKFLIRKYYFILHSEIIFKRRYI